MKPLLLSALIAVLCAACNTVTPEQAEQVRTDVKVFEDKSKALIDEVHGHKESTDKLRGEVDGLKKDLKENWVTKESFNALKQKSEDALVEQAGAFGKAFGEFTKELIEKYNKISTKVEEQNDKIHGNDVLFEKYDEFREKALDKDREKVVKVVLDVKKVVDESIGQQKELHKGIAARLKALEDHKDKGIAKAAAIETEQKNLEKKTKKVEEDASALEDAFADKIKNTDTTIFWLVVALAALCILFLIYIIRNQLPALLAMVPGFGKKSGDKPAEPPS